MKIIDKISDWSEKHETALNLTLPIGIAGLASGVIFSLNPSKVDDPQAAEVLIAGQEAIRSSVELVIRIVTNPFILAIFIFAGVSILLLSRGDSRE